MAFPTEVSRISGGGSSTAQTAHAVTMPATVNAGELLEVFMSIESGGTVDFTGGIPAGWSTIKHGLNTSANINAILFCKVADGSEGGSVVTFTTVDPHRWEAQSAVVSGFFGALAGVEASVDSTGGFAGTNDPPLLAPSFGGEDILWQVFKARNDINTSDTISYPSGYASGLYGAHGSTTATKISAASASRQATVVSEDPSAFGGTAGVCMTIAVRAADTRPIKGLTYDPIEGALYILRGG